jgi:outer membrane protein
MKRLSAILSPLALAGAIFFLASCTDSKKSDKSAHATEQASTGNASTGKIAFVNIDTLEANYIYLKTKKDEFSKRQAGMEAELERSMRQLQNDAAEFSKKAQSGGMTQSEGEAGQKRLLQMQESLEKRKSALADQLMKEQADFNKDLHDRLDAFLKKYNDGRYDYILSYGEGGAILYKNDALDITWDIINGMNEGMKAGNSASADTTKKK